MLGREHALRSKKRVYANECEETAFKQTVNWKRRFEFLSALSCRVVVKLEKQDGAGYRRDRERERIMDEERRGEELR